MKSENVGSLFSNAVVSIFIDGCNTHQIKTPPNVEVNFDRNTYLGENQYAKLIGYRVRLLDQTSRAHTRCRSPSTKPTLTASYSFSLVAPIVPDAK